MDGEMQMNTFAKIMNKRANHYMLGGDAYLKSLDCPYPDNSPEQKEWLNGFLDTQFLKERF